MLFLLDKAEAGALRVVPFLAGDADKELLLIGDGVYLAREAMASRLAEWNFDGIHAEAKALAERGIEPGGHCEATEMSDIVDLVLEHGKILSL
ncbi:hypothetical protein [Desulfovibrio aminophilus]|uniref:hypothetical protein n=1 Tax=Desulfovibrio aminophilus TaxID=81425 RepID=UPI0033995B11